MTLALAILAFAREFGQMEKAVENLTTRVEILERAPERPIGARGESCIALSEQFGRAAQEGDGPAQERLWQAIEAMNCPAFETSYPGNRAAPVDEEKAPTE